MHQHTLQMLHNYHILASRLMIGKCNALQKGTLHFDINQEILSEREIIMQTESCLMSELAPS